MISAIAFVFYATGSMALGQQDPSPTQGTINLYSTMTNMLNGKSSQSAEAEFLYRNMGFGTTYVGVLVDSEAKKSAGHVFGFEVDGKTFVNPRKPKLKRANNFFEVQRIGPFLHYKVAEGGSTSPNAVPIRYLSEKLLNIETGKIRALTRKRFRKLAKDDVELLQRFEKEKQKSRVLTSYLKEYYERKQK